jgi:hypothetical protein
MKRAFFSMSHKKSVPRYEIIPSDPSDEWLIIQLKDKKIRVDFQKQILGFRYDCIPHPVKVVGLQNEKISCSRFCCYAGCYIGPIEVKFIESILPALKKAYLPKDSLEVLEKRHDEFYIPEDYDPDEDLYKTRCAPHELQVGSSETSDDKTDNSESKNERNSESKNERNSESKNENNSESKNENNSESESTEPSDATKTSSSSECDNILTYEDNILELPPQHCIFLMDDGLCSIHKYCVEHNLDWYIYKFNICTTFPMDLRVTSNATSNDAVWPLEKRIDDECSTTKMMEDFETFLHCKMDCINLNPNVKKEKKVPFIIDSMKYAFVSRYGQELWDALNDYAKKYRKEHQIV